MTLYIFQMRITQRHYLKEYDQLQYQKHVPPDGVFIFPIYPHKTIVILIELEENHSFWYTKYKQPVDTSKTV